MNKIKVKDTEISVTGFSDDDYVCLTDIARMVNKEFPFYVIRNWMRLRSTIEYLGLWEKLNNKNFNMTEFDQFKNQAGSNTFVMTPVKWIKSTNATGIKAGRGKYSGGTFAHRDIALEFAAWISAEIKLYIIKEFQRLKFEEAKQLEWSGKRLLTKLNYLIQTEAVKKHLIPVTLSEEQKNHIYASEADILNIALFGVTAKQWSNSNQDKTGNVRDYASTIELAILSNLEFMNAKMIHKGVTQKERLLLLNKEANYENELFNKNNLIVKKK